MGRRTGFCFFGFNFQNSTLYPVECTHSVSLQRSATDVPVETVRTLISPPQSLGLPALHPVPVRGPAAPWAPRRGARGLVLGSVSCRGGVILPQAQLALGHLFLTPPKCLLQQS